MRLKQLFHPRVLMPVSNEENKFLLKHKDGMIDLNSLEPRDSRIAENLIIKDILCKINNNQAMVNEYVSVQYKRTQ